LVHAQLQLRRSREPTEDDVLGPFYRHRAPFRAKVCPPLAAGAVVLIAGRIWGVDTKRPIANCHLDIWQANDAGRYDNDDPTHPPSPTMFTNRTRLQSDEHGHYEFETIYPGAYKMDETTWRSPHIHFLVRAFGFKTLVTQLFFAGAPYLESDPFVKKSLIIPLAEHRSRGGTYKVGRFDIVLANDVDETQMT
jgi:protocatechuate 3,4-dioxygenase beta subunit